MCFRVEYQHFVDFPVFEETLSGAEGGILFAGTSDGPGEWGAWAREVLLCEGHTQLITPPRPRPRCGHARTHGLPVGALPVLRAVRYELQH